MSKSIMILLVLILPSKSYSEIWGSYLEGGFLGHRYCFEAASQRYSVHPTLLWAIAKVESGFHPYAISYRENGQNKSIYPDSLELTKKWIDWLWKEGLDFDLGIGQINRRNIAAYKINPYSLLDPCYNLNWSAYILRTVIDRFGYSWEGISHYNGGGLSYASKVWKAIKGLKK